jgi:methanogenic corrinoid protein MtbC1
MQAHLAGGLSAAEAARAAVQEEVPAASGVEAAGDGPAGLKESLARALDEFDEPAAQAVLDRLFSALTVEAVVRDTLMPYLRDLGERWADGAVTVAQEHFASNVIRGRLASLARGWGLGRGPRAVLACAPGELHDIALLAFGVVLHRNGWRIEYLGADTPVEDVIRMARTTGPDLVVLTATQSQGFNSLVTELRQLAQIAPLAIGGPAAAPALAAAVGARLLSGDPVSAAEQLPTPEAPRTAGPG